MKLVSLALRSFDLFEDNSSNARFCKAPSEPPIPLYVEKSIYFDFIFFERVSFHGSFLYLCPIDASCDVGTV